MLDLLIWLSFVVVGWVLGWYSRDIASPTGRRNPDEVRVKWRVLEIVFLDDLKTQEQYRFLYSREYDNWEDAQAEARKLTDEDTLKNTFKKEYTVVEAP
jgi:hypothetical protein